MKRLLFILILFSNLAFAKTFSFGNEKIGFVKIEYVDVGPTYERYRMHITVTCKDRRTVKNLVVPVAEDVIPAEYVCAYAPPTYDPDKTEVKITFGKAVMQIGPAGCDGYTQPFNIELLCSAWSR